MTDPFSPLELRRGPALPSRFILAPMTNRQSPDAGRLSEDEFNWLAARASTGFGMLMTCATAVRAQGVGFPGQLGIYADHHIDGLERLAGRLNQGGAHSVVQLHHAGIRSPADLIEGPAEGPSDHAETGSRGLTLVEVAALKGDFVRAAKRAERAGFHGVEIHGAHGYILAQFINPTLNLRTDRYGGDLEGRARLLFEIVEEVLGACGPDFSVGVRISTQRYEGALSELLWLTDHFMAQAQIDYLDVSLWDVFKVAQEEGFDDRPIMCHVTDRKTGAVPLAVAGNIRTGEQVRRALELGADLLSIGKAAILHHDFPRRVASDPDFTPAPMPVSRDYLRAQSLGETFIDYLTLWPDFVEEEAPS